MKSANFLIPQIVKSLNYPLVCVCSRLLEAPGIRGFKGYTAHQHLWAFFWGGLLSYCWPISPCRVLSITLSSAVLPLFCSHLCVVSFPSVPSLLLSALHVHFFPLSFFVTFVCRPMTGVHRQVTLLPLFFLLLVRYRSGSFLNFSLFSDPHLATFFYFLLFSSGATFC